MLIPRNLRSALDSCLEGVSRSSLMERAERISSLYRDRAGSSVAVRDAMDALAYAITRSPATYGAVSNVLEHLRQRNPEFEPANALDLGSGAGAASWAVAEYWPQIRAIAQVDFNLPLLSVNRILAQHSTCDALRKATQITTDLTRNEDLPSADLVILSYMLSELSEIQIQSLVEAAWKRCNGAIVIVEPGTPKGYQHILTARQVLLKIGARLLAPCPHELPCPLAAPDWCHFVQRVERSRDHRILKSAALPYEDEKFSYLIGLREPLFVPAGSGRVLARPERGKTAIRAKICTPTGEASLVTINRREKERFSQAKKREWGDDF